MKFVRITLSLVVLLLIVGAVAIAALMLFVDPGKLRPVIAEEVHKQTGYDVVIDGQFSWSFYPRFGIQVGHIALHMPQQATPFLDLHRVIFVTELRQLLQGNQKLKGDIYIAELQLLNLHAQKAHVGLRWQDQMLTLQPMNAELYDGKFEGVARGTALSNVPRWEWDVRLSDVQMRSLLSDVNGADSKLKMSGIGQFDIKGATLGKTREEILGNLNGTSTFSLKSGTLEGIDLNYMVKSADALINKQPVVAPSSKLDQTDFDQFSGSAMIKNGVASVNDMALLAPALTATGAGSINLMANVINIQLRISPIKEARTQWVIPVMVSGSLFGPDVRLDATELNILVAKQQLDNVRIKLRNEIKQRVPGKTGEVLQGLLGK